jgi:hypothetical protein
VRYVCHRQNSQCIFPSNSPFGTASGTSSGTKSDTSSSTWSMGELAVAVLAACAGRIGEMGFSHPRGLQLLIS